MALFKKESVRFRLSGKMVGIGLVLLALLVVELFFDVFEIAIGRLFLFTNPVRPKIGRLWEEDQKEQVGLDELSSVEQSDTTAPAIEQPIRSLEDLQAVLSMRHSLSLNRDEFKEFYRSVPPKQAQEILDPLDLMAMDRNSDWQKTQLSLSGDQLVIYFLDGYEKPLHESHVSLGQEAAESAYASVSELEKLDKFRGRIIPAHVFYQAFDQLPRSYQLQIVNDPYKLVQWGSALQRVGLSLFVEEDGVEVIFEIRENSRTTLQSMYASEVAVEYLVKEINAAEESLNLQTPTRKNDDAEKDN